VHLQQACERSDLAPVTEFAAQAKLSIIELATFVAAFDMQQKYL
jgi:hypothetical protein